MYNKRITSDQEFICKIHELATLFGFDFEINANETFIIVNGKRLKMEVSPKDFFYIENNNYKICFNQMFAQRLLETSCLIEIYVTNGKDRTYCKYDQELYPAPSGTTLELPNFTFCEYSNGKTHTFFSNMHQLETIESDALINPIYDKMLLFENAKLANSNKQVNSNFTRFLFGVNSEIKKHYAPLVQLDMIRKKLGHSFKLFCSEFSITYSEWLDVYKYNPSKTFYSIPCMDKIYSKALKSECEFLTGLTLPKKYADRLLSIVRRRESVDCVNNTINYFSNSIVWPYISNYYLDLIEYVKNLQNDEVYKDSVKLYSFNKKLLKTSK